MTKLMSGGQREGVRPVAVVGPTASGKTAAACELAVRLGAEIVSADSMAIYRGMDVGTAKPTAEEQKSVRFHMIDVVDPDEPFTVADFQERASQIVNDLLQKGIVPLIVGGTGLYVRALIDGLNIPGPGPNLEIREQLEVFAREKGREYLHQELAKVDPDSAARLHPNDLKRVIRALEVYRQTGKPMTQVIEQTKAEEPRYPSTVFIGFTMARQALYERIEKRVDELTRLGLVEEVRGLLARGYDTDLPPMQGLGYKEIAAHLKGELSLEEAVVVLKRDTRRFAKRQYTWFRADSRISWMDVDRLSPSEVADAMEARLLVEG